MYRQSGSVLAVCLLLFTLGCGGDDDDTPCDLATGGGCEVEQICEVVDDAPTCVGVVAVEGQVLDAVSAEGLSDARVVALDSNGAARSAVAVTDSEGRYTLPIRAERAADGAPRGSFLTLRVDAAAHQPFPEPPRTSLPLDLADAVSSDGRFVLSGPLSDVVLLPRHAEGATGTLVGIVDHAEAAGALVVALEGGRAASTAVVDTDGTFVLFDVSPGLTVVEAYRRGLVVTPAQVEVVSEETAEVTLSASEVGLTRVSGQVNIVNAPGGSETTVILALASTFDPVRVTAQAPAGLRAVAVTGDFSIEGVPPGEYVVLAAYENDGLVRDPDEGIGGTEIVRVTVAREPELTLDASFKVTEALEVVSPGADEMEAVSAAPRFEWVDDSSEDGYELRVYDALGELVYEDLNVPGVSGELSVSATWADAQLTAGMVYQFRAWSFRDRQGGRTYISATEDLKGVFTFAP